MKITKRIVQKLIRVVDAGLTSGKGRPEPGRMCVEAAVCYALGLEHSDDPKCVSPAVRAFKIDLNDSPWRNDKARAAGLRRLAVAQLGSDIISSVEFSRRLSFKTITRLLPEVLDLAGLKKEAADCRNSKNLTEAEAAAEAAAAAARVAGRDTAAQLAAELAARVATAVAAAARVATAVTAAARSAWIHSAPDPDYFLRLSADLALEVLIELKSPGCEWLYLL